MPGIADPHHFNADSNPLLYFNADPDQVFHGNADPDLDPAPLQIDGNLRTLPSTSLQLKGSLLSLRASIVSVDGPSRLSCEPLKLFKAFHSNTDPKIMQIRIRNPGRYQP